MTRTAWIVAGSLSALTLALAVALVIALAGSNDEAGDSGVPAPAQTQELDAFEDCLAERGVEPPEPGQPGIVTPDDEMAEAFEACRELAPGGGPSGPLQFGAPPGSG